MGCGASKKDDPWSGPEPPPLGGRQRMISFADEQPRQSERASAHQPESEPESGMEPESEPEPGSVEEAIQEVVDQIWGTYDVDESGVLEKEEAKKFVQDTLAEVGQGDDFSEEAFGEFLQTFDKDNSGTIEKAELQVFIMQVVG